MHRVDVSETCGANIGRDADVKTPPPPRPFSADWTEQSRRSIAVAPSSMQGLNSREIRPNASGMMPSSTRIIALSRRPSGTPERIATGIFRNENANSAIKSSETGNLLVLKRDRGHDDTIYGIFSRYRHTKEGIEAWRDEENRKEITNRRKFLACPSDEYNFR